MKAASTSRSSDDFLEARLIEGKVITVPLVDFRLVDVNNGDADLWAILGYDGHSDSANIAGTDAADVRDLGSGSRCGHDGVARQQRPCFDVAF